MEAFCCRGAVGWMPSLPANAVCGCGGSHLCLDRGRAHSVLGGESEALKIAYVEFKLRSAWAILRPSGNRIFFWKFEPMQLLSLNAYQVAPGLTISANLIIAKTAPVMELRLDGPRSRFGLLPSVKPLSPVFCALAGQIECPVLRFAVGATFASKE